ncbi:MAG: PD-(D/E)XK nuclease family protein [bacterium]
MKISHFKLSMFLECPLRYKFYYIDELKEYCKPKPYHSMGISIHSALEKFFCQEQRSLDILHNLLRKNWVREGYSSRNEERMWGLKALAMLKDFYEGANVDINPAMLEAEFSVSFDSFTLTGRIDRVDKIEKGYEVIDYKTGAGMTRDEVDKDLQMTIYSIGFYHTHKVIPRKLTFHFLKDSTKITTTRSEQDIENGVLFIKEIVEKMKDETKFSPKPNRFCAYCDFTILCPSFQKNAYII